MKIHEYQAKAILAQFNVPVPRGQVAYTVEEAEAAARALGGSVVVKAQIHAGGRRNGGGVKVAKKACPSSANCTWASCSTACRANRCSWLRRRAAWRSKRWPPRRRN